MQAAALSKYIPNKVYLLDKIFKLGTVNIKITFDA